MYPITGRSPNNTVRAPNAPITAIFFVTLFSNNAEFIVLMCRNKSIMSIEIYIRNVIKPLIDGYIAGLEKYDKI